MSSISNISTRYGMNLDLLSPARKPTPPGAGNAKSVEQMRKAAEGLVATSFIKPVLAQARESNNAPPPFGPTNAEKQFGSLLDNRIADEIAHAANFPIVDRLVEQFTRNMPEGGNGAGVDLRA